MSADFADSLRTERHFEAPDEFEQVERAIARTTLALARPADLMRQAHAEERTEAVESKRLDLHAASAEGWITTETTAWWACTCTTGTHHPYLIERTPARDEDEADRLAGLLHGHVISSPTFTMTLPAGVAL